MLLTREQWRQALQAIDKNRPIIECHIAGSRVEYHGVGDWQDVGETAAFDSEPKNYRIAAPKRRPFLLGEIATGTRIRQNGYPPGDEYIVLHANRCGVSVHGFEISYALLAKEWLMWSEAQHNWIPCSVEEK